MMLERHTNKCYYMDITEYLDEYQNKCSLTSRKQVNRQYRK